MRISDWSSDVCSSDLAAVGESVACRTERQHVCNHGHVDGTLKHVVVAAIAAGVGIAGAHMPFDLVGLRPRGDPTPGAAQGRIAERCALPTAKHLESLDIDQFTVYMGLSNSQAGRLNR